MKRTVNAVALKEWKLTVKTICKVTGIPEDELFPVAEDNGDEPPPGGRAA
jgi:hypothetical protein